MAQIAQLSPDSDAPAASLASDPGPAGLSPMGLFTLLAGVFLALTDFFIVNVALPTIDRDLHASSGMLQLVVAGYAVSYALLLVVGGRLGDALGRRSFFLAGMAAFTLASLGCGLSPDIGVLVACRFLQGISAALMMPQVLSTIQATSTGERRARALGLFGVTVGLGMVAGQLFGGLLVAANIDGTGWRPIFLVNVPVGAVGLMLARRHVPSTRSPAPAPVDVPGTVLLAVALLALLVPLTEGRSLGWPWWTVLLLVLSPFSAAGFWLVERHQERIGGVPLVPISVLVVPSMRRGLTIGVPFFSAFGGFMFVYVLVLQDSAHLSALDTGLTLVPYAAGFLATSLGMARLVARYGRKVLGTGGVVLFVGLVGLAAVIFTGWPHPAVWSVLGPSFVAGVGQGLIMTPIMRIVLSEVPAELAGVGSGVLVTTQQTSLALGVAVLGSAYLTLSSPAHVGPLHAALVVFAWLMAVAAGVAIASRGLPD